MKTKFIGLNGFGEIETLKTTRRVKKHYAKKTARLLKRTVQTACFFVQSIKTPKKKQKQTTPTLDACYKNARTGGKNEFSVKILDFSHHSRKQLKKQSYAVDYSRGFQPVSGNFIKHKAVLGTMTAGFAGIFAVFAVFSAMGVTSGEENAEVSSALSRPLSFSQSEKTAAFVNTATADSAAPENSEMYESIALAVSEEGVPAQGAGLYIDGAFIGACADEDALYQALDGILREYAKDYENVISVKFANEINVDSGEYEASALASARELVQSAKDMLKIILTEEITFEREIAYDTQTEYDDSATADYSEVKQEGETGVETVTCRVTYVDGVQTDSVEVDSRITREPTDEIIVEGTQEIPSEGETTGFFIWPVPNTHTVTSGYGYRWGTTHTGLDISNGVYGETIVASDSGVVAWAGYDDSGYGNYVVIDHGNGYQTLYGHCSSVYVSEGEYVSQGQEIAGMGSTGDSTGTHLHFEIHLGASRLDPAEFVS